MGAFRWAGVGVLGFVGFGMLFAGGAALFDRPSSRPVRLDRDAPEVVAFFAAERAWMATLDLAFTEHLLQVGDPGLRIRVLEVGDGPPVLVLPGGAGYVGHFAPLLAALDGYRFLLIELPGGGGSDGIDFRAVDYRQLVRDVLDEVYDRFDLDAVPMLASSRGGHHAWWYALDRPERVSASVQLGVPGYVEGTQVPAMLGLLGIPGLNHLLAATVLVPGSPDDAVASLEQVFGHPSETVRTLPDEFKTYWCAAQKLPTHGLTLRTAHELTLRLAGLRGWDPAVLITSAELAELNHPTLLVWPSNDPYGGPDVGRQLADILPDARLVEAGVGHVPWLDDTPAIATLVGDFLWESESDGQRGSEDAAP